MADNIILYTGPTPNGRKVSIMLEELDLPYETRYVDILEGDQHKPEFLALNPNNKFPVLIDPLGPEGEEIVLWESGAILWYLAEKTGRLLPAHGTGRHLVHQWLMFQMSGVGPMFGQFAHFYYYAKDKHPYAIERYGSEMRRLLKVMDAHLEHRTWFAGDEYSIADISILPWVEGAVATQTGIDHLQAWSSRMKSRPQVQRGLDVGRERVRPEIVEGGMQGFNDAHRDQLFGKAQYARNTE